MSDPMDGHLQPVLSDDEIRALDDALWYVDGGSGGPAPAIGSKARKAIALLRAALGE